MPAARTPRKFPAGALGLAASTAMTMAAALLASARTDDRRPDYRPAAYAVVGATIHPGTGPAIENGVVVVRDGTIEAVGKAEEVAIPADAETIDAKGMAVYPGFIDLYTTLGVPADAVRSRTGAGRNVPYSDFAYPATPPDNRLGMTPEFEVAGALDLADATAEERRKLGFTDILSAPGQAIAGGQSALVSLSGLPRREAIVRAPVAQHIILRNPSGSAFFEGHGEAMACEAMAHDLANTAPGDPPTPAPAAEPAKRAATRVSAYPSALMGVIAHLRQAMLDADYQQESAAFYAKSGGARPPVDPSLEALTAAKTRKVATWWEANTRDEIHRALDLAEEFGTDATIVGGREAARVADRLKARGTAVVLRLDFPEEPKVPTEADYRKREPAEQNDPRRVLVHRNAKWKERVETARELHKAGVKFAFATDGLTKADTTHAQVRKVIAAGLPADAAIAALTSDAAAIAGVGNRLGTIERGKAGHLVVMTSAYADDKAKPRYVLADGQKFDLDKPGATPKKKDAEPKKKDDAEGKEKDDAAKPKPEEKKAEPAKAEPAKPEAPKAAAPAATAAAPAAKPTTDDQPSPGPFLDVASELEEDRTPKIKTGGNVLIKNVTILTVSKAGTIAKGSILVKGGKIAAIGDVEATAGVQVIDGNGMVAMPGIIDTHSHMAIAGGVNEATLSIVPEVRVRDVVDGSDESIYRALAGGTTSARLLHGSANTIGGQDVVIKLRQGRPGRELILQDDLRPQGVKFALGENVTRRTGRFPNTRMGVEATIERAFEEGKAYRARLAAHAASKAKGEAVAPFRRDLRLEALGAIVEGSIKIHSHCYRNDEILMLLRICERYGVRVQSLQHVLEGYKVAAEIAAHGASASTFSDWWAYKVEAFDAIPFNAALMTRAGVKVCIKSDSDELVRHLNLEAAKMVKYGNVTEAQALEMITLNPARELGLEHRIGSIEVGKDADIALFNAHPFDSFARVEMSLIDGEVYFQRHRDESPSRRPGAHVAMPTTEARDRPLAIAANPRGLYALVGATVHPVSGPDVANGTVVVAEGKITAVGGPETPIPSGAQTVDLKGLDVWPGLIDAGSVVGLFEIGSVTETQDVADSAPMQPELRTSVALHPDSELIPVTRGNGVLTSYVQPGGGTISGQGCLAELDGWVPSEMVLVDRLALNVTIPAYTPPDPDGGRRPRFGAAADADPNARRKERLEAIKEEFRRALAYDKVVAASKAGKVAAPTPDPRLVALAPYARGEKPVIFRADRRVEILDALKLAEELKLKAIITGGAEAWRVADALKAAKVPVLIAGTLKLPNDATEPYDAPFAAPAKLQAAGVAFAIRSIGSGADQAMQARNLPHEAGMAVAYGLPEAEALKAVTLYPAQILGVADKLGSIEVGKRANLVIAAGSPLQATTEIKALFLGGKPETPASKHTRLYDKFRRRLDEVKSGGAPLGLDVASPAPIKPAAGGGTTTSGGERR